MIKEKIFYTIICDGCGTDLNKDCDYTYWDDIDYNEECAKEASWEKIDDKHYCENCLEWDEEQDKRIPKNKNK
jgi:hypothetical protein